MAFNLIVKKHKAEVEALWARLLADTVNPCISATFGD